MKCAWHCCSNELPDLERNRRFCSSRCKSKYYVDLRRKKVKQLSLDYLGNRCSICGYNRCSEALEFHHEDGSKEFGISQSGHTRSWDRVKLELDKCVLLCANCHREAHAAQS